MRRSDFNQQKQLLDDALRYGATIDEGKPEKAMIAKYACVLASGYIENIIRLYLSEYTRLKKPKVELESYIEASLDRFQNPEYSRILECVGRFNATWRKKLESVDEAFQVAINSVVANRHLIAHGRNSGISLYGIAGYVAKIEKFEKEFAKICK